MNLCIIGVGNIGIYHIRDFLKYKCNIKAILLPNEKSGKNKQLLIKNKYKIDVNYYTDLNILLKNETIDLLIICSPTETHLKYIEIGIKNNINIFCEKPFIYNLDSDNLFISKNLFQIAKQKNININVNTQWVYGINQIKHLLPYKLTHISLYMEHYKTSDNIDFYTENISHMNSIIIFLLGNHKPSNIIINSTKYPIVISFLYNNINIEYKLGHPHNKNIIYKFNTMEFIRYTDIQYNQFFIHNNINIPLTDPFSLSIKNFINNTTLINNIDILNNIELTDLITQKLYLNHNL